MILNLQFIEEKKKIHYNFHIMRLYLKERHQIGSHPNLGY